MTAHRVFPGEVRQVGHLVADLDAAVTAWRAAGIGPWTVVDSRLEGASYRGVRDDVDLRVGFANSGPLQIELIEARGDAVSTWHEARDSERFGPNHIAYWTADFAGAIDRAARAGFSVVQNGGAYEFAYVERPAGGLLIELMALDEGARAFMDGIRAASESWDGRT